MLRAISYSEYKNCGRPLTLSFVTYWRNYVISIVSIALLVSCGSFSWHSIEQTPAKSIAYMRDGVYVSGDYVRSASIAEIDGKSISKSDNNVVEIVLGEHQVKIYCDEAKGEFDSNKFRGKAKTLKFNAKIQRTYLVHCVPFTHWWIEDLENSKVVAGEKLN